MTLEERKSLAAWFEEYIDRFRDRKGNLHPMLMLKREHSLRVAANARLISDALGASEAEQHLAEGAGLVHDVGRFPQFETYGSFRDADTVNHGAEGRKVLEAQDLSCIPDSEDRKRLLCAVEFHNRNRDDIPEGLSGGQSRLLDLVRDADKLDIMELVLQSVAADGFRELPDMLPHIRLGGEVNPDILDEALTTRSVSIGKLASVADFLVMIATWFYDLNYQPTRKIAHQRNIFSRLKRQLPRTEDIETLFSGIEKHMPNL